MLGKTTSIISVLLFLWGVFTGVGNFISEVNANTQHRKSYNDRMEKVIDNQNDISSTLKLIHQDLESTKCKQEDMSVDINSIQNILMSK